MLKFSATKNESELIGLIVYRYIKQVQRLAIPVTHRDRLVLEMDIEATRSDANSGKEQE